MTAWVVWHWPADKTEAEAAQILKGLPDARIREGGLTTPADLLKCVEHAISLQRAVRIEQLPVVPRHDVKVEELAGFELVGHRTPDGRLVLGSGQVHDDMAIVADWPDQVRLNGVTFVRENIRTFEGEATEWCSYTWPQYS